MAGRNQHFIPKFHQRAFGIRERGRPKDIWVYRKGLAPEALSIKENAADQDFYSDPDNPALDSRITDIETPLARQVAALRALASGSGVEAAHALDIILHLAPRTDHLRSTITRAMQSLLDGVQTVLLNPDNVKRLLGLHTGGPSPKFTEAISRKLDRDPQLAVIGLPAPVLEKIAFQIAKESFDAAFSSTFTSMGGVVEELMATTQAHARETHTSVLEKFLSKGIQRERLLDWIWTVEGAPEGGLVLPDCVALGRHKDGAIHAFMLAGNADLDAAFMPLGTEKILVGRPAEAPLPPLDGVNEAAAACSWTFFGAHANTAEWAALSELVGTRAHAVIDEAMSSAIEEFVAPPDPEPTLAENQIKQIADGGQPISISYQVSFLDCADQKTAETIAANVNVITNSLQHWMSLGHLEGITFAADYGAAVAGMDRGREDLKPAQSVDPSIGIGYAKVVPIIRNGALRARLVLASDVGYALIGEEEYPREWAVHVIVRQLAYISLQQMYDDVLPGVMLRPLEGLPGYLYSATDGALGGYVASRQAAGFGPHVDNQALLEDLLLAALERATMQIKPLRFAYRYHGDLDRFLAEILPMVGDVVERTAQLLGHCEGLERTAFPFDGKLVERFQDLHLDKWLAVFQKDLGTFFDTLGAWESLDDLLAYNRHVERVLWQFGVFPWVDDVGNGRVEIPLASDALELLEAQQSSEPLLS